MVVSFQAGCIEFATRHLSTEIRRPLPTKCLCHAAAGLSPAWSGSDVGAQRDSHRSRGNGGERAGRSRERRNGCGSLRQAGGPRRYSRGLVAARYVACQSAPSVPGGPPGGKAGGLRRECCGSALPWDVERAVEGAIESWGVGVGEIQPSSRSTSPFRTAQTTISCLLPNPSLSWMW